MALTAAAVASLWLPGIHAESFGCVTDIDCTQAGCSAACKCHCLSDGSGRCILRRLLLSRTSQAQWSAHLWCRQRIPMPMGSSASGMVTMHEQS